MQILSNRWRQLIFCVAVLCAACLPVSAVRAQQPVPDTGRSQPAASPDRDELSAAPATVDVKPVARDEEIRTRLQSVLEATGWFIEPQVRIDEGIVFLNGRAETEELRK